MNEHLSQPQPLPLHMREATSNARLRWRLSEIGPTTVLTLLAIVIIVLILVTGETTRVTLALLTSVFVAIATRREGFREWAAKSRRRPANGPYTR